MTGSNGNLSGKEWQEQREFLKIELPDTVMLILVSVQSGFTEKIPAGAVPEELYKNDSGKKIMRNLIGRVQACICVHEPVSGCCGNDRRL